MLILSYLITGIAILMLIDSLFVLFHFKEIENIFRQFFPSLNVKQLAIIELVAALLILLARMIGQTYALESSLLDTMRLSRTPRTTAKTQNSL